METETDAAPTPTSSIPTNNSGEVTTLAGGSRSGYVDGNGSAAKFSDPYGVTVDSSGNVYVADLSNHRIRKITQQ